MTNIVSKKKPVIQKGQGYVYDPLTFATEHAVPIFKEAATAQEILDNIVPYEFMGRKFIFFDTETHPYYQSSQDVPPGVVRRWVGSGKKAVPQDYPFSLQICDGTKAYAIYDSIENGLKILKCLAPLLEDPTVEKVAHNTKFDMHMTANAGGRIVGKLHDTVVVAKLANENRTDFALRALAAHYPQGITKFEYMVDNYKQLNHVTDYRQIPRELLTQYGCADVWNCFLAFITEYQKIVEDDLVSLYETEMEVMIVLYAMERRGMLTDAEYKNEVISTLTKETEAAEAAVYELAGYMFNMNSGKQVYKVMMEMGVDPSVIEISDKGNPVLDADAMEKLDEVYQIPIISKIQAYKKAEKLLNTYAIGIYSQVDSEGYVHASVNQTEATTGRMSITKPALQTLPKKNKSIRKMFIPPENATLWFMDLDQIEYRLFAHYAKAAGLIEAINAGHDVHKATGALIFHKDIDNVTDDERGSAKTTNFALVYGQGNEHTAEMLHMTMTETILFKAQYFASIPEAKPFINTVHSVIKQRGFVKNFYGRRRRLSSNDAYKAPNALIQGCAADYIKDKMRNSYKYLVYNNLHSYLSNIVHDELISCIYDDEVQHAPYLRWLLSDFTNFRCKITAGVERGNPSWGQKEEVNLEFKQPEDDGYLSYNLFDGHVFDI